MSDKRNDPGCAARLLAELEKEACITATSRTMIERFMTRWDVSAYHALLMTELLTESELANALAKSLGLPRLYNLRALSFADEAIAVLPFKRAREWECLPLRSEGAHEGLELVCADPTRQDRIDELRQGLKCEITLAVGERSDIVKAIDELYPLSAQLPSLYLTK